MTMKKIICPTCHKKTKYLYKMNAGIFCDHDWEAQLVRQNMNLMMDNLRLRLNLPFYPK